jgi:hypothetical protein
MALHSIQNYGNAFHIYYPVQCTVFLSSLTYHYLLKWINTTKYLSKDDNIYCSLSLTPLITSDTFQGSEIYSQWHLKQNDAMQCALAWDILGVWPSADNPAGGEWRGHDTCHTHHWRMPCTELFVYHMDTLERNVDCRQTMSNKCWQLPATFWNS